MTFSSSFASLQAADTVVMVQARDGLDTAAAIATVAIAVVLLLILGALMLLLFHLRAVQRHGYGLSGRLMKRLEPLVDRGREIVANVEFITGALRTDVQRVSDSVRSLSERLQGASDRMEERVEEFNALMEVVQSEAEDLFIGSAAAMRGVRAGARALRDGGPTAVGRGGGDGSELDEGVPMETPEALHVTASETEETARRSGGA